MDSDYQLQPNLNLTRVFVFKVDAFTIRRHHGSNFKIAYTTFFLIILVSEGSICFSSTLITWSLINLTTATKCLNFSSPQRHELTTMRHELATMLEYEAQKLLPPYVHQTNLALCWHASQITGTPSGIRRCSLRS